MAFCFRTNNASETHGRNGVDDLEWIPGQARDDDAVVLPFILRRRFISPDASRNAGARCVNLVATKPENDEAAMVATNLPR